MTAATLDARALVEAAQAGDRDAFGALYERYREQVFRFVYFRVGNRHVAEDLTSEAFLRALRRLDQFTWQGTDPGAWLVTIARNLIADHYKSGRYRLEVAANEHGPGVYDLDTDRRRDPVEVAEVNELSAETARLLRTLTPDQRAVLALRFIADLSIEETARRMGREVGAVKALQYRASNALCQAAGVVPPQRRRTTRNAGGRGRPS